MDWWSRRSRGQKIGIGAVGALLAIAGISGGNDEADTTASTTTAAVEAGEGSGTEATTAIAETTSVAETTTTTVAPTTTTASTTTTTTTTIPEWSDPIVLTGSGDDVVDIEIPQDDIAIAAFDHSGSSNFSVTSYTADGDRIDLLVNEIGNYVGRRPINLFVGDEVAFMEVSADGAWTIELQPLIYATQFVGSSVSGSGADVVVDPNPSSSAGRLEITHTGESNFAIWVYSADDTDLLVNEIGDYSGTVLSIAGGILYDISADGDWTISR